MTRSFKLSLPAASLVALSALLLAGCDFTTAKSEATAPPPPKVVAVNPTVKAITEWDEYTGRFAAVESGLAQLVYLILFSYALFNEGWSGLTITIGAIVTLFVAMQATGRLRFSGREDAAWLA